MISNFQNEHQHPVGAENLKWAKIRAYLLGAIVLLLVLLFLRSHGWAQEPGLGDTGNQIKHVICDSGCSSSSSPSYGATFPATGTPVGFKQGANLSWATVDGSNNLNVNCTLGCSASVGFADNAAFTAGTTPLNISGGWYTTSPTNCTSGSACAPQLTLDRKLLVQAFQGTSPWVVSNSGTFAVQAAESGTWNVTVNTALPAGTNVIGHVITDSGSTTAVTGTVTVSGTVTTTPPANASTNLTQVNSVALGSPSAYGTSPGAVNVPGVNAFITNTPAVTLASTTVTGTVAVTESGTWNVSVNTALPAGTNVIGHVISDTGSTTAVTGTVAVAQTASTPATATLQSAAVASGNGTLLATNGQSAAILTVNCATCSGGTTVNFEGTEDNVNFTAVSSVLIGTNTIASSTTTAGLTEWEMPVAGFQNIRARISGYSAGTVTVTGHAVPVPFNPKVINANIVNTPAVSQSGTWNVTVNAALPAGTNVIGHVINDTGSTTAVTGNVTVAQATGTNLHAVLDTTSTTAVTQATGTNLHAVLDTTSTTAVTQATGTNLHAVIDSGSTTAVTGNVTVVQATGTNLHTVCDSGCSSSAGFADNAAFTTGTTAINPVGGLFDDTPPTAITTGKAASARITANRALHMNLRNQAGTEIGTAATPVQVSLANTGANSNKLLVTPDSVALPANQSVNVSQINGATTVTGATGVQKVAISDSLANGVSAFPATFLRTTDEPRQVFYDPFDSAIDTTNRWTAPTINAPGVIAANSAGVMTMGTGATASGWSKLTTQNSFTLPIPAWMSFSFAIALNDGAAPNVNAERFWGEGTIPSTPTVGVPITDGVGFEMSGAKMYAVVYAAGVRTVVQDLSSATGNSTQPVDALNHRYIVFVRTDKIYFYIDGLTSAQLVATANFQAPTVQTLAETFVAVGNASNAANSTIACSGAVVADTGKNATQLADGTFPWRKATISAAGNLQTSIATALPAGSAVIGHVINDSGSTTAVTGNVTVAQATGTNLHAVLDTTSTTAVTQATGTNLHAVLDTTSTTAVTQATAANLNNTDANDGSTGSAVPAKAGYIAGNASGNLTGLTVCDNRKAFSSAATTALKLVALVSAKQVYICSINIVVAGANNVALVEGTKTTTECDTATAGLAGGTTAATGWNFAANGGLTQGTGIGVVAATATVAHDVCLFFSAATQVSGVISWTQF